MSWPLADAATAARAPGATGPPALCRVDEDEDEVGMAYVESAIDEGDASGAPVVTPPPALQPPPPVTDRFVNKYEVYAEESVAGVAGEWSTMVTWAACPYRSTTP